MNHSSYYGAPKTAIGIPVDAGYTGLNHVGG
jgi:hypothetical protein